MQNRNKWQLKLEEEKKAAENKALAEAKKAYDAALAAFKEAKSDRETKLENLNYARQKLDALQQLPQEKLFKRIEKLIENQIEKLMETSNATVWMQNIFATPKTIDHKDRPKGEFDLTLVVGIDTAKARVETDAEVTRRMMHTIENMTNYATDIHLALNFFKDEHDQWLMKTDKQNHITRLAFSEFCFYPAEERGPLPVASFNQLLKQIAELAKTCPENLHLSIGTFPVRDKYNNVHNVAIYAQGGRIPKLALTTKSIAWEDDPKFRNTIRFGFQPAADLDFVDKFNKTFQILLNQLYQNLLLNKPIELQAVDDLITLAEMKKDWVPIPKLLITLNSLKDDIQKKNINSETLNKTLSYLLARNGELNNFLAPADSDNPSEEFLQASAEMLDQAIAGVDATFSRNIECTTAGGAKFFVAQELCYEHNWTIALKAQQSTIQQTLGSGTTQPISPTVSHLVTSNTIALKPDSRLSDLTEHADAKINRAGVSRWLNEEPLKFHSIQHESQQPFGGTFVLTCPSPVQLHKLSGKLQEHVNLIEWHNAITQEFLKFKMLRHQYPKLKNDYEKSFYLYVLEFSKTMFADLHKNNQFPSSYQPLAEQINLMIDQLNKGQNPATDQIQLLLDQLTRVSREQNLIAAMGANIIKNVLLGIRAKEPKIATTEVKTAIPTKEEKKSESTADYYRASLLSLESLIEITPSSAKEESRLRTYQNEYVDILTSLAKTYLNYDNLQADIDFFKARQKFLKTIFNRTPIASAFIIKQHIMLAHMYIDFSKLDHQQQKFDDSIKHLQAAIACFREYNENWTTIEPVNFTNYQQMLADLCYESILRSINNNNFAKASEHFTLLIEVAEKLEKGEEFITTLKEKIKPLLEEQKSEGYSQMRLFKEKFVDPKTSLKPPRIV